MELIKLISDIMTILGTWLPFILTYCFLDELSKWLNKTKVSSKCKHLFDLLIEILIGIGFWFTFFAMYTINNG